MEGFIESWIECPLNELERFVKWLQFMGYNHVICEFPENKINSQSIQINSLPVFSNLQIYNRKTLDKTTKSQSKQQLNHLRQKFIIISQLCNDPTITKWACLDQRIDFLVFNLSDIHLLADDSTVRLIHENEKFLEINCHEIFQRKGNPISLLRNIKKVIHRCIKKQVPILLSSKAKNPFSLRAPRSVLGMAEFLGITPSYYQEISKLSLYQRIDRNINRLNTDYFIGPGISKTK
jgi:RNase P/RNase MRP subunit p30